MGRLLLAFAAASLALTFGIRAEEENPVSKKDDPDRVICKNIKITGSHIPRRECHTAREWEQMRKDAQATMRTSDNHQINCSDAPSAC